MDLSAQLGQEPHPRGHVPIGQEARADLFVGCFAEPSPAPTSVTTGQRRSRGRARAGSPVDRGLARSSHAGDQQPAAERVSAARQRRRPQVTAASEAPGRRPAVFGFAALGAPAALDAGDPDHRVVSRPSPTWADVAEGLLVPGACRPVTGWESVERPRCRGGRTRSCCARAERLLRARARVVELEGAHLASAYGPSCGGIGPARSRIG